MFDKNLPVTESENKIAFHPSAQESTGGESQQAQEGQYIATQRDRDPEALTFNEEQPAQRSYMSRMPKRLYPG